MRCRSRVTSLPLARAAGLAAALSITTMATAAEPTSALAANRQVVLDF